MTGLTKDKRLWIEVWVWTGVPPTSGPRKNMVDIFRGDISLTVRVGIGIHIEEWVEVALPSW